MATEFQEKVYAIVKKIPKGKTMSYKEVAEKINSSPRAVGQALKKNPYKDVPCHRVIQTNGSAGGYLGAKNSKKKIYLLEKEKK